MKRVDFFEITLMAAGILVPLIYAKVPTEFFEISVIEFMIPFMAIGFVLRVKKECLILKSNILDKIFLALLIWVGISTFKAIDHNKTLHEFVWLFESFLIFYMVGHSGLNKDSFERLFRAWAYGVLAISLFGLLQYQVKYTGLGMIRIGSTLTNSNSLSGYLIIFLPMLISFMYQKPKKQKAFWWILVTIVSTTLVLTYTRGGWYAAILAITLMALLLKRKSLILLMIIYLGFYSWAIPMTQERAVSGLNPSKDTTANYRLQLWNVGLKMWEENPIEGVGVGNYYLLHDEYIKKYPSLKGVKEEPHNSFVKFLAENGLIGLGLFLALLMGIIWRIYLLYRFAKDDDPRMPSILSVGSICGFVAFLLQSNTNSLFQDPRVAFNMWLILGLIHSIYILEVQSNLASSPSGSGRPVRV